MSDKKFLISCADEAEFTFLGRARYHYRQGKQWEELSHTYVLNDDDNVIHSVDVPDFRVVNGTELDAAVDNIESVLNNMEEIIVGQEKQLNGIKPRRAYVRRKPLMSAQSRKVLEALNTLNHNPIRDKFLKILIEAGPTNVAHLYNEGIHKNDFLGAMTHFGKAMRRTFSESKLGHRPIRELVVMKHGGISLTEHGKEAAIRYLNS